MANLNIRKSYSAVFITAENKIEKFKNGSYFYLEMFDNKNISNKKRMKKSTLCCLQS